jgi:two-component system OmpR family response regulator
LANLLIADDDGHIREVVRYALEKAGHHVLEACDGSEALKIIEEQPVDLVVLDIVMPEQDGIEVCKKLFATNKLPIVFLTSRDDELDRVLGLELGADDYVTKPFSPRELVARVKAVLRRTASKNVVEDPSFCHGPLKLDPDRHTCYFDGKELELTVTEFALLQTLLSLPGKAYSRAELVDRSYGHGHFIEDRTIDSHIRRIRKKLGEAGANEFIETVHGLGYRLKA